jgi:DNA repair photolyase
MIRFHAKVSNALTQQKNIDMFNFPFTLNVTNGCLYGCKYCYLQKEPYCYQTQFGTEMIVKTWLPEKLDEELSKYQELPQHLKRVQINNASECYHPMVISETQRQLNRDIMAEVYEVFERQWNNTNKFWNNDNNWMLHIVTKSNIILNHLDILKRIKHMVQVEITLITADQNICREYERFTPSINKRLEVIKRLSDEGIFVRVMATPFVAKVGQSHDKIKGELERLKDITFECGARAFKNKGLNYFSDHDVRTGQPQKVKWQENYHIPELVIKSGEQVKPTESAMVLMPDQENWATKDWPNRVKEKEMQIIDLGYSEMNSGIDLEYII